MTTALGYYVDIRLDKHSEGVQWAFAGKTHTTNRGRNADGNEIWHGMWEHWIDSQHPAGFQDEGDMELLPDGTVFEKGVMVVNGQTQQQYEELWEDLAFGPGKIVVLQARMLQGLVIIVDHICQGVARDSNGLTVERWQRRAISSEESWQCLFRSGTVDLPCPELFHSRNIGLGQEISTKHDIWEVVEETWLETRCPS